MKKYQNKIITAIVIILLSGLAIRSFIHKNYPPKMGFNATELITVDGNKKITINDYRGSVVIVSCFQTWCGDCAGETPVINQLATTINSEKFKVIYITDEGNDKLNSFRSRLPSDKILFTYSAKSLASLGVYVYPTTFLLNKSGDVIKTKLEGYDWLQEEAVIKKLIAE
jgi:thiol-disulfide isomerase/thioredoxin